MKKEIWKDVPGYEGLYKVSDHGRVKSLLRVIMMSNGRPRTIRERIMRPSVNSAGYLMVGLCKDKQQRGRNVHKLVAEAFLGHERCGMKVVVDHINHDKTDNRVENLRLVTQRENTSHRKKKGSSKYPGVYWNKRDQKWMAYIWIDVKKKYLGLFEIEEEAAQAYLDALKEHLESAKEQLI